MTFWIESIAKNIPALNYQALPNCTLRALDIERASDTRRALDNAIEQFSISSRRNCLKKELILNPVSI